MSLGEIERQVMEDLIHRPAKTAMEQIIAHQRYKEAFNAILKEKGSITPEDIEKYYKLNKEPI